MRLDFKDAALLPHTVLVEQMPSPIIIAGLCSVHDVSCCERVPVE